MDNLSNVVRLDTYRRPAVSFYRPNIDHLLSNNQADIICFYKARREKAGYIG